MERNKAVSLVLLLLVFFEGLALFFLRQNEIIQFSIRSSLEALAYGEEKYIYKRLRIPQDMHVFGITPRLTGGNILHHAILAYEGARAEYYFCPDQSLVLFGSGSELTTLSLPSPYGFFLKKGEVISLLAHFSNDQNMAVKTNFSLEFFARRKGQNVTPLYLVAGVPAKGPCNENHLISYNIPQGLALHEAKLNEPYHMQRPGELLYWKAHIHEYGETLTLMKNSTIVDTMQPKENPNKEGEKGIYLGSKLFNPPLEMEKGDILDIKAVYKKPPNLLIRDAMGMGYLIFDYNK